MGGDIKVTSTVGAGSTFRVKLLLSEVSNPTRIAPIAKPVFGYHGPRKTILVTDDDPTQRDLLRQVLGPLGFIILSAQDGPSCLSLAQHCRPDLFLLDISMPGMDGWRIAEALRAAGHHHARILMISASALEAHGPPLAQIHHDGYLMKPVDVARLLEQIGQLLRIDWQYASHETPDPVWTPGSGPLPSVQDVRELIDLGQIGHIKAIGDKLDQLAADYPEHGAFVARIRALVDAFDFNQYIATLKMLHPQDLSSDELHSDLPSARGLQRDER
jgi:CheY-like chemotaxis protein